jgi:hypothetical protein
LIFSRDGALLSNPSIPAIRWLRQISRLHKKIFEVCEPERVEAEISQFKTTDSSLPSRAEIRSSIDPYARKVAQLLFGKLIGEALATVGDGKHGPGAVSEHFGVNERWGFDSISYNIEALVGPEYFRSSWIDLLERPPSIQEVPARLIAVPKTAVKPRLISIEPAYNQFVQQALQLRLKDLLERGDFACSYTYQHHNQRMALQGSIDGKIATIDLSEASDRVSLALVEELFGFNPSFIRYLKLSRSRFVQTEDDDLILLNKFASMGSALTFPVESMVFMTLVVTVLCRMRGDFSERTIKSYRKRSGTLSIYGDDIIIPVDAYPNVVQSLTSLGMKVNDSKSFSSGKFRESCGVDAYDGRVVTPAYARAYLPESRAKSNELVKASSLRNQLFERFGEIQTVRFLDSHRETREVSNHPPRVLTGTTVGSFKSAERQGVANNFFANTNPDRNEASMGVTMIELLRGDIPSVLKNFRKMTEEAQSLRKTLGSDYLNIAFGWAPLISEAANLLKIGLSIDRAIYYESFRRQRQWDGPSVRTNAVVSGVSLGYTRSPVGTFNYGGSSVSAPYSSGNGISLSNIERVTVRQEDYSFTSRYTGIAKPPSLANYHMERALNMAQRLGVINDPQLIWELMPYSWLVDWFSTMGSSISNANTYSPMKGKYSVDYAYVTTKHVVEETLDFTTGKFNNPTLLRSFAWRNPVSYGATTCKWRDRATPFGFGTQLGSLSASQFGILVALGLAKSR